MSLQDEIDFFRLKTTVLAEKLFRPADQRSTADSTFMAHVKFTVSGSWTRQISLFQKLQLARGQDLSTMLRFIFSAETVVLGQKSII